MAISSVGPLATRKSEGSRLLVPDRQLRYHGRALVGGALANYWGDFWGYPEG
jgi:hypothetical protein